MHSLGQTRSANHRDHLLQTPDTFVRTPLPELTGGLAIVHVSPQHRGPSGAGFTQMTIEFGPGGTLRQGPTQRFLYVLEGELVLTESSPPYTHRLVPGSYAYMPAGFSHLVSARTSARTVIVEKPFVPLSPDAIKDNYEFDEVPSPWFFISHEQEFEGTPLNGDPGLLVRSLLPDSSATGGLGFDFAVNIMTYAPGASLSQVEIHTMEHGLLMLEGGGIYRLNDHWYPTTAGDFIWMAPFCPQWFGALGKTPAKYIIYKDFNRHPLV